MGRFKFEDYRQPWETGPHWELKREFMEKYSDMFAEDRLLCLAQAYSNIVLMNCSYPEPVMRQISLLAKPLEMRKKFQGVTDASEGKSTQNQDQRGEKIKAIYQKSGRPFKQIKFCSSEDPQTVEQQSQESVIMHANFSQETTSMLSSATSNSVATQQQPKIISNTEDSKSINDAKSGEIQKTECSDLKIYKSIVDSLGIEFIQKFSQKIRTSILKGNASVVSVINAAASLKADKMIDFKIDLKPNCLPHSPTYCCQFTINNCLISSGEANNKKKAKAKSAETGIDLLMKLSSDISFQSKNSIVLESDVQNPSGNITEKPMDLNTLPENCPKQIYSYELHVDMIKILQKLAEHIQPANSPLVSLNRAIKKLPIQNHLQFERSETSQHEQKMLFNNILLSSVDVRNVKRSKLELAEIAINKLKNLSKYEIQNGELKEKSANQLGKIELISNMNYSTEAPPKNISVVEKLPFILNLSLFNSSMHDKFVLVDNLIYKTVIKSAKTVLTDSASFCHMQIGYDFEFFPECGLHKAEVHIGDIVVASGTGSNKEGAKLSACSAALEMLRKKYYTLQVTAMCTDSSNIRRNQVYDTNSSSSDALTDENIGCKMLKSMGWRGGGLGISGIEEPVGIDARHSFGKGLGFVKKGEDFSVFKKRINSLLQELSKSDSLDDLVFSKEFSKEERKHIHQIAGRYKLHTVSRGIDDERFLIVRRKYAIDEILSHLEKIGGSNSKFQLLDSSKDELNPFVFAEQT